MTSPLLGLPPKLQTKVREWKELYRRVYLVEVLDEEETRVVVLRGLSKREADVLDGEPDEVLHMEKTFRLALLHPDVGALDDWSAGAVNHIYVSICNVSGWGDDNLIPVMNAATEEIETLHGAMTAFICGGLQALKPADVYEMTALELGKHLRMAEYNLGRQFEFERWTDPEAWIRKNRENMRRVPGGRQQPSQDPREAAAAMGERSKEEILNDPSAVKFSDPKEIRKMIRNFELGKQM